MKAFDCDQYSPEWWRLRRGVPTASEFGRILTPKTMKLASAADDYVCELVGDIACLSSDYAAFRPTSKAMDAGTLTEPEARRYYEMETGQDVQQVGFCMTDDERFGCSPDGLVGEDGGLELKCPLLKTQAAYLMDGGLPAEYRAQVHGCLIITGRAWWDFLSYAPGLDPLLIRVTPDEYTLALRGALEIFWVRFQEAKAKLLRPVYVE